jgi:hypothetical protein
VPDLNFTTILFGVLGLIIVWALTERWRRERAWRKQRERQHQTGVDH